MVYVFYNNIGEASNEKAIDVIFNSFPATLQSKIVAYKKKEDRKRVIAGKALLAEAMKILDIDYGLDKIKYTLHHRPYFDDSFDFNISHSDDFVVCAISRTNCVGIDIEKIRPVDINDLKIGFRDEDWRTVLDADDQLHAFFSLWTKRESFLKALGIGFTQLLSAVNYNTNKIAWNQKEWSLRQITLHKNYCCHLTVDQPHLQVELKEINFNRGY